MSTSDYYYNQVFDYLLSAGSKIKVSNNFHGQITQIDTILKNDHTALISTVLDFMVHSATVDIQFNTDNSNLTKVLQNWKKVLNTGIGIDIPRGLRSFTEQYFRERWRSSFIVLNIKWAKLDGYWLPSKMWFTDGASMYVNNNTGNLTATKYYIGKPTSDQRNLLPRANTDILVRKPYNQWYDEYPTPYLVKRGAIYHALFKQKILEKQGTVIESILPLLATIKMGCAEAMKKGIMPKKEDFEGMEEKFKNIRKDYDEYTASKGLVGAFPFDVNFEQLIPDLSKILNSDITQNSDKNLLSALGLIELVGFSNSREETILNPKVLVEEVVDAVLDYIELLDDVMAMVKVKNTTLHRKSMNNDIRIASGPIKSFITNDMKLLYRSWYDRGLISRSSSVEDTTGLNFEVQLNKIRKERTDGIIQDTYPPVILNQEQHADESDNPEQLKENSPEKKKTEKDIEKSLLEEDEIILEPLTSISQIPQQIKNELSKEEQQIFKKAFNEQFEKCSDMDNKLREYTSLDYAYNLAKKELVMAPYNRNKDLPQAIKVLPAKGQTLWRNIFNESVKNGDSDDVARKKAWAGTKRVYKKNKDGKWIKK